MVDGRRAVRCWFLRRMSWLLPGLVASIVVFARLATDSSLELWLRLPAMAIAGVVALLFMGLTLVPILVFRSWNRGNRRRAQSLRREFRSYPTVALLSLSLALILLAIPLLFAPGPPVPAPHLRTLAGPRSHRVPDPVLSDPAAETPAAAPVELDPPKSESPLAKASQDSTPLPVAPQEKTPEVESAAPPVPVVAVQDLPTELRKPEIPAAPAAELPAGQELFTLKFRPEFEDLSLSSASLRKGLDRGGLPEDSDPEDWQRPEIQLDLTIVPNTRGWYGAIYGTSIDVPVSRDTSFRASYFLANLNDAEGEVELELEASIAWNRATIEIEQRLAGYTRKSTFDLAIRGGFSVDRLDTNQAQISVSSAARPAPWAGLEVALWEQEGVGVVAQVGHSFAVRINEIASSVTDFRIELKIDLSEKISFQIGWRYLALRVHDKGSSGGVPFDELERSSSGPVAGLGIRF